MLAMPYRHFFWWYTSNVSTVGISQFSLPQSLENGGLAIAIKVFKLSDSKNPGSRSVSPL